MKKIIIMCLMLLFAGQHAFSQEVESKILKLNTSNQGKYREFKRLFEQYGYELEATKIDLEEVDADPITVIAHKASQVGDGIIVEDTSLEIEGADVGVNVRWLMDHLSDYVGRKAVWVVLLAYRSNEKILIYEGFVRGTIVDSKGSTGFGFDPVFLPNGAQETLAESKPDKYNARAKAVEAFVNCQLLMEHDVISEWDGPWQKGD